MEPIVVFDGVCNLCANTVQFILKHEPAPTLRFASAQSMACSRLMREFGLDPDNAKSFVLVEHGNAYVRSAAAIRIARYLRRVGVVSVLVRARIS